MDKTTEDIIKYYDAIVKSGFSIYISKYHSDIIIEWDRMLKEGKINDEYKKNRNMLYGLFVLLYNGIYVRSELVEFLLETIRTHSNPNVTETYDNLRNVVDNFTAFDRMDYGDYSNLIGTIYSIYDIYMPKEDMLNSYKTVASIMLKYDGNNRFLSSIFSPPKEIGLDEVLLSIYGK